MEPSQTEITDAIATALRMEAGRQVDTNNGLLDFDFLAMAAIRVYDLYQRRAIRAMGYNAMVKHMSELWAEHHAGEAERDKQRDARAGL